MKKIIIIFWLSIAASLAAFFLVLDWEESKRQQEFSIRSQAHTAAIRKGLEYIAKQQEDMRFLIENNFNDQSNNHKNPNDFIQMLSPIITHESAIIDIHWGILNADKVIQFVTGWENGEDIASHPIEPTQEPIKAYFIKESGVLELLSPIKNINNTIDENALLKGETVAWLISEWDIAELIEQSLSFSPVSAMDIHLSYINQEETTDIYLHQSRSRSASEKEVQTDVRSINVFTFKGLLIQAEFTAAPQFFRDSPIILAWQSLVMWLLASLTLTWFLYRREKRRVQLRRIIDNLQDVYYRTDINWKIHFVSQSISSFGYTQKEWVGTQMLDYFCNPDAFKTLDHSLKKSSTKTIQNYHVQIRHKDGSKLWISLNAKYVLDKKGRPVSIEGTLNDFTETKENLEKIQQADKLESLGAMASGIAHNFNNISAVIIGHASLARMININNKDLENHLLEIEKASEGASAICSQMIAYTEQGSHHLESLNISQAIHNSSELIHASFSNLAEVRFNLQKNIPKVNYVDPAKIQQMIFDLIQNAAESYSDNYGIVHVDTGVQRLNQPNIHHCVGSKTHTPGDYVFIRISDHGCGIPENKKAQVFEPFFSTKFVGRGLGLSAARGIVLSYNGLISLETRENRGTTITIFLPVDNSAA